MASKFKVGEKVRRAYDRRQFKVVKVKETRSYDYLVEDSEGARVWTSEGGLSRKKK